MGNIYNSKKSPVFGFSYEVIDLIVRHAKDPRQAVYIVGVFLNCEFRA